MFFGEARRYSENEYEWLRDVHDHLDRINIRLFTSMIVTSRRNSATRSRHIPASRRVAEERLEALH